MSEKMRESAHQRAVEIADEFTERFHEEFYNLDVSLKDLLVGILERHLRALEAKIAELEQANAVMREALEDARSAISTLPIDALGTGRSGELEWPIRDELLDKITKALD